MWFVTDSLNLSFVCKSKSDLSKIGFFYFMNTREKRENEIKL